MKKGQTILEVLIALGVGIVILSSIVLVVLVSLSSAKFARDQSLATQYAQEGMEVVRVIRDRSWTEFSALTATDYCLGEDETLLSVRPVGGACSKIDNLFTRGVTITWSVERATVTVEVSWVDSRGQHQSRLVSYFTRWSSQ